MKIVRLEAENVKRLQAVEITPEGDLITIGGRNAQGKTSVLDSIEMALAGKSAVPSDPIRHGQDSARVVVETDKLIVTRRFTPKGTYLEVCNREGMSYKGPQKILDDLSASLAFDPIRFMRQKPADQAETLRELCGIDTAMIDRDISQYREIRLELHRELKQKVGYADGLPHHPDAPEEQISVSDLITERDEVIKRNDDRDWNEDVVSQCEAEIGRLKKLIAEAHQKAEKSRARLQELGPEESVADLTEKIGAAESVNEQVRENVVRAAAVREAERAKAMHEAADRKLKACEEKRAEIIGAAELPIDGLEIGEDGRVVFQGVPLEQASSAEQLRVSVAITSALSPALRVMLVRDGSLLDDDSMKLLAKFAAEQGAQVWVERVGDGDRGAVIIEDGQIRETEGTDDAE